MKILFVCTGNTCRSPMAEALLRHYLPDAEVQSAGIFAVENDQANQNAMRALADRNISIDHRSQPIKETLLHWADIVLTMTTQHKQSLIIQHPEFQDKYFTLKEYVSEADKEIWDELKQSYANYEAKRSLFIQENELKLDSQQLNERLDEHLREDIMEIRHLESNLISYDISDPFGGDFSVYQDTLRELDASISLLVKKLEK